MLTRHFLQQSGRQLGVEPKRMGLGAMDRLQGFDFPGNVRQLENICHWLTVMAPAQHIAVKDLPPEVLEIQAADAGSLAVQPFVVPATMSAPVNAPVGVASAQGHGQGGQVQDFGQSYTSAAFGVQGGVHAGEPSAALSAEAQAASAAPATDLQWLQGLGRSARDLLDQGRNGVWEQLTQQFEAQLLRTALAVTHGRRVEAAQRLGIGRNTITRKLQELGLDDEDFDK